MVHTFSITSHSKQDDQEIPNIDDRIEDEKQFAAAKARRRHLSSEKRRLSGGQQRVTMDEQVAFKERVENLQVTSFTVISSLLSTKNNLQ